MVRLKEQKNLKLLSEFALNCGKELSDENTAKSETREITTGAMDGRKAVDIWCANCGQRNVFVLPVE